MEQVTEERQVATLEMDRDLHYETKRAALEERMTLRAFVERAVREALDRRNHKKEPRKT